MPTRFSGQGGIPSSARIDHAGSSDRPAGGRGVALITHPTSREHHADRFNEPSAGAARPGRILTGLLRIQTWILREMAAGRPAQALAEELCRRVRHYAPNHIVTLMQVGRDGLLHPVAAAGASPAVLAAIDGLAPGLSNGSCAAAVYHGVPVLVEDASRDPRWAERRDLAAAHGIHACWSHPVSQGGRLIGSFALTGPEPGAPVPALRGLLEHAAAIAGSVLQLLELQDAQRRQAERVRRLAGFNAMLAQVNQLAASRPDTASLYAGICRIAVAQAGLRLVWIGAPDGAGVVRPIAAAGVTGFLDEVVVSADPALPEGRGLSGTAWREARTVVCQRFAPDTMMAPWFESARRVGLGAGAALPLMLRGVPQAVLHVFAAEEGVLDAELVGLVEELAVDIGRALEALDQQRHLDRLQALHTALLTEGEILLQARSEAEMLQKTSAQLGTSSLFHVTWIVRPDAEGVMRPLAGAGPGMALLAQQRLALDDEPPAFIVRTWRAGRPLVHNDLLGDSDLTRYGEMFVRDGWRSAAAVPVLRGGAQFAVMLLGSQHPALFTPDVLALCERIAGLLGRGLDELDLKETLEQERSRQFHLARHDPLTGLPNRLLFEEHLGHALARAERRGTPLAVCLVDIDDFKPVNDRWGHHAGDAMLREVATRLHDVVRRSDLVARLGGDEFVLAIEDLGTLRALPGLLERLSAAIETPIDLGPGGTPIGLSVGVAVFPEDGEDADILLRRADAALYVAKARKAVRNQDWQRWNADLAPDPVAAPGLDDPYGTEAQRLLRATATVWPDLAAGFLDDFYRDLARHPLAAPLLAALAPEELARLKTRQQAHLRLLMDPATDRSGAAPPGPGDRPGPCPGRRRWRAADAGDWHLPGASDRAARGAAAASGRPAEPADPGDRPAAGRRHRADGGQDRHHRRLLHRLAAPPAAPRYPLGRCRPGAAGCDGGAAGDHGRLPATSGHGRAVPGSGEQQRRRRVLPRHPGHERGGTCGRPGAARRPRPDGGSLAYRRDRGLDQFPDRPAHRPLACRGAAARRAQRRGAAAA